MKHSKPVQNLKHLEHLEHLKILKCSSVKHFQVLNRFKMKIIIFSLNHTFKTTKFSVMKCIVAAFIHFPKYKNVVHHIVIEPKNNYFYFEPVQHLKMFNT